MSVVGVSARGQVPPFYVMRILEAVAHLRLRSPGDHLTAGQPSTSAPAQVRAEAHHVLDADRIGYTGALGLPVLRDAIAAHYRRTYGIGVQPGDVAVSTGSSGAFLLAFLAGVRTRRRCRRRAARIPGVPEHAHRAWLHGGGDALRAGNALPTDDPHARCAGCGAGWPRSRESGQSDRVDGAAERTRCHFALV